jgi:hypothetical protein
MENKESNKVIRVCPICHMDYELGINGVGGENPGCDKCLGIERQEDGTVWEPGVESYEFVNLSDPVDDEHTYVVMRPDNLIKTWENNNTWKK